MHRSGCGSGFVILVGVVKQYDMHHNMVISDTYHSPANQGTLFRASSLATMLMDQYMKSKCGDYLHHVLQGVITEVQECNESCEVNITHTFNSHNCILS